MYSYARSAGLLLHRKEEFRIGNSDDRQISNVYVKGYLINWLINNCWGKDNYIPIVQKICLNVTEMFSSNFVLVQCNIQNVYEFVCKYLCVVTVFELQIKLNNIVIG